MALLALGSLMSLAVVAGRPSQAGMGQITIKQGAQATAPVVAAGARPGSRAFMQQEPVRDVAVTGIQSPVEAVLRGETVIINVAVHNRGTAGETLAASLHDDTEQRGIATVYVTLNPGQTLTIGFPWDTGRASGGEHTLTATAQAPEDQDPGNDSLTLDTPITVNIDEIVLGLPDNQARPDASFGGTFHRPAITTRAEARTSLFIANARATFGRGLGGPGINTPTMRRQSIFIANADAVFPQPTLPPGIRFELPMIEGQVELPGRVQGSVSLQGHEEDSRGGFVMVADRVAAFLDQRGEFSFFAPDEQPFELVITAPGYLSVVLQGVSVDRGQVLTIPELTLPYGDANGDGKIDILDLSLSTSNFGRFVEVR